MSTSAPTPNPETSPAPGLNSWQPRLSYTAYYVADVDRALAFYVGVLGFKEVMRVPLGQGRHEVVLSFPNHRGGGLILMWDTRRQEPFQLGDGYSRVVITVADVDAATAHVVQHGASIVTPPTDAGPMRYSMFKDPDGYVLELLQLKRG